ncbi:MAG: AraC family transcriptional regulator, partial [Spirochaetes bacterium]|nr:AraC family transcriptional regulator [Spirochaetota bacterium]
YFFTGLFHKYPVFSFVGEINFLLYLVGPLQYFYVISLITPSFRLKKIHLLHLLPALGVAFYVLINNMMKSSSEIELFWESYINDHTYHFSFINTCIIVIIIIHIGIYFTIALHLLSEHKRNIKNYFSSIEHVNLSWLYYIVRFSLYIYVLIELVQIYWIFGGAYGWIITQRIFPVLVTVLIYAVGYKGIMQPGIFYTIQDINKEKKEFPEIRNSIQTVKNAEITERLLYVMNEKKPYLDPGLTLPVLAEMLSVSRSSLSQVINADQNQNFFDFINIYRIKTAREYLENPEKKDLNVLQIAFLSGFNSKTTFNSSFKKVTGFTPTEYRKSFVNRENHEKL